MDSAATVLALETDSAWVVILAVSLVTLLAALIVRRLIGRPGGLASGLLLAMPLVLPLLAALLYQHGVLPEVSVLQPARTALLERSGLLHLLLMADGSTGTYTAYALTGSAGPWLMLLGLSASSFMLIRRAIGTVLVHRLIRRCRPLDDEHHYVQQTASRLGRKAGLKIPPPVLLLPPAVSGAFAVGARTGKILISRDLIDTLELDELEAILAHEVAHLQARDVPLIFAAGFMRDLVAWNPLAHVALRRLADDREFEADRRAAALTQDPLAVASGLLKMFELVKQQPGRRQRAALAFLRPGSRISRRVTGLLAIADGRSSMVSVGSWPFALASLLVALLGLQVGQQLATDSSGALAIVLGAPDGSAGEIWKAPRKAAAGGGGLAAEKRPGPIKVRGAERPIRYPELESGVMVRQSDVDSWLQAVEARMRAVGVREVTLRWEARREWKIEPLISGPLVGPNVGIYRINQQI